MACINRIEVANLLRNKKAGAIWVPKIKHILTEFCGKNSLIIMKNGAGKSSLIKNILYIINKDAVYFSNAVKGMFAPRDIGVYTHCRIELIESNCMTYVYGIFGTSEGISRYHYRGRFEDIPIGVGTGPSFKLYGKEMFDQILKNSDLISIENRKLSNEIYNFQSKYLMEMNCAFQKEGGGEGNGTIFGIPETKDIKKFASSLMQKAIAPILLTPTGQIIIQDKKQPANQIIDVLNDYVQQEESVKKAQQELDLWITGNRSLITLRDSKKTMEDAVQKHRESKNDLDAKLRNLCWLVENADIPGVMKFDEPENKITRKLMTGAFVDAEQKVYFPSKAVKEIIDYEKQPITMRNKPVAFSKFLKTENIFYLSVDDVKEIVDTVSLEKKRNEYREAVKNAVASLINNDTNIFKMRYIGIMIQLGQCVSSISELSRQITDSERTIEAYEFGIKQRDENKIIYDRLSRVLTAEEINDPVRTYTNLLKAKEDIEEEERKFKNTFNRFLPFKYDFEKIQKVFPDKNLDYVRVYLKERETYHAETLSKVDRNIEAAETELQGLESSKKTLEKQIRDNTNKLASLKAPYEKALPFLQKFPKSSCRAADLEAAEKEEAALNRDRESVQRQISALTTDIGHLESWQIDSPHIDARTYLASHNQRISTLHAEIIELQGDIDTVRKHKARIEIGKLPTDFTDENPIFSSYTPLYQFIRQNDISAEVRKKLLHSFATVLSAPVAADQDEALEYLRYFETRDMVCPVFIADRLIKAITNGQQDIFELFAGYHSERNEILILPEKFENLRREYDARLAALEVKLDAIKESFRKAETDPLRYKAVIVMDILKRHDPLKLRRQFQIRHAEFEKRLSQITSRFPMEDRELIRDARDFFRLCIDQCGSISGYYTLIEKQPGLEREFSYLEDRINAIKNRLQHFRSEKEKHLNEKNVDLKRFESVTIELVNKVQKGYIDQSGPKFMDNANKTENDIKHRYTEIINKLAFPEQEYLAAKAHIDSLDSDQKELETRKIQEMDLLNSLKCSRDAKEKLRRELSAECRKQADALLKYDEMLFDILKVYHSYGQNLTRKEVLTCEDEKLGAYVHRLDNPEIDNFDEIMANIRNYIVDSYDIGKLNSECEYLLHIAESAITAYDNEYKNFSEILETNKSIEAYKSYLLKDISYDGLCKIIADQERELLVKQKEVDNQRSASEKTKAEAFKTTSDTLQTSNQNYKSLTRFLRNYNGNIKFKIKCTVPNHDQKDIVDHLIADIFNKIRQLYEFRRKNQGEAISDEIIKSHSRKMMNDCIQQIYTTIFRDPSIYILRDGANPEHFSGEFSSGEFFAYQLALMLQISEFYASEILRSGESQGFFIVDGIFSKLSESKLIKDCLGRAKHSNFQLIGFAHDITDISKFDKDIFDVMYIGNTFEYSLPNHDFTSEYECLTKSTIEDILFSVNRLPDEEFDPEEETKTSVEIEHESVA